MIAIWAYRHGRTDDSSRAYPYGRKYQRIASYELAGYRDDLNLLRAYYDPDDGHIDYVDIDPSFPGRAHETKWVQTDLLDGHIDLLDDWLAQEEAPNLLREFFPDGLKGEPGPWVLLNGYVSNADGAKQRRCFAYCQGYFLARDDVDELIKRVSDVELTVRRPPEPLTDFYTFGGEIPWCITYPLNGPTDWTFVVDTIEEDVVEDQMVITKDGVMLDAEAEREFWNSLEMRVLSIDDPELLIGPKNAEGVLEEELAKRCLSRESRKVTVTKNVDRYRDVSVLSPVRSNNWEGSRSVVNTHRNVDTPARELTDVLKLRGQPQTFDLFDEEGKRASISLVDSEDREDYHVMTFLRRDLLEQYLNSSEQVLVWVAWGMREHYQPTDWASVADSKPRKEPNGFKFIHRFG